MGASTNPASTVTPRPNPMAPSVNPAVTNNVFQQAAGAQRQAQQTMGGLASFQPQGMQAATLGPVERMQAVGQVADINAPGQIDVNQLATTDFSAYMNPYNQQVVDLAGQDIERQRQMANNQLGAQASAAGAFGGSRQGVAESLTNAEFARQAAQTSAGLRQQGFQTALQSGQFDIGQTQAARTLGSQQEMQARTFNQQAAEAAANREQAARAGNMQAANAFALQQAQFEQAANQSNFGGQFQAAGVRAGGAGQLGGLGQQLFGQGQDITRQQQDFGARQQAMNQALIEAARGQYGGFTGAPQGALQLPLAAVGASNMGQKTQTDARQPGLFDYLQMGAQTAGSYFASDRRLKTNVQPLGQRNGVNVYSWDWTEEGAKIASPDQPTVGVMADELILTHPHLVHRAADGYLRVNYSGL